MRLDRKQRLVLLLPPCQRSRRLVVASDSALVGWSPLTAEPAKYRAASKRRFCKAVSAGTVRYQHQRCLTVYCLLLSLFASISFSVAWSIVPLSATCSSQTRTRWGGGGPKYKSCTILHVMSYNDIEKYTSTQESTKESSTGIPPPRPCPL
jgi:hypothetical protein